MKLKIWNYINQSTRNSTRNTKNTLEGGLACVVCEIWTKNANPKKRSKIEKRRQGIVRHFFQKSMKLKIWNYIYQSTRNTMSTTKNTVQGGLASVVCEISAKNANPQKRSKIEKRRQGIVRHFLQKSMKLKILNYIYQSTRNSIRNTKNTVERGLACVVIETLALHDDLPIWSKIEKRRQGIVRHFFQKSMKLKIWNYIYQSTRNSKRNKKNTKNEV